jgi:hypothetical protein
MLLGLSSTLSLIWNFSYKVIVFHLIQTVAIFRVPYFAPQYPRGALFSATGETGLEILKNAGALFSATGETSLEILKNAGALFSATGETSLEMLKNAGALFSATGETGLEMLKRTAIPAKLEGG